MSEFNKEVILSELDKLAAQEPPHKKITKMNQIRELEGKIRALLKQGWRAEDIVASLKKGGLELTPDALKNQLYRLNKERRGQEGNNENNAKKETVSARTPRHQKQDTASPAARQSSNDLHFERR